MNVYSPKVLQKNTKLTELIQNGEISEVMEFLNLQNLLSDKACMNECFLYAIQNRKISNFTESFIDELSMYAKI